MKLIINDAQLGEVTNYQQDREKEAWIFTITNKFTVSVPFSEIKLFTYSSSWDLEIITK